MVGIDTNVLVRYFARGDARQFDAARRLIEKRLSPESPGHVSLVALAETVWVLDARYKAGRELLMTLVATLLSDARFVVQGANSVWLALEACEAGGIDLADALVRYLDHDAGCTRTVTFDRKAARHAGYELLEA